MMHQQRIKAYRGTRVRTLGLPAPDEELLPGVRWGSYTDFFTSAFWATRAWLEEPGGRYENYRLGATLTEEVAACLLGGHGIRAEVGLAAFERLRAQGALVPPVRAEDLEALLRHPLLVDGRIVAYRFARQKAGYLAASINGLATLGLVSGDERAFRDSLLSLPGIGLKTASWITRNWLRSDQVAIIDVHIARACIAAGVYPSCASPAKDYAALEETFLNWAKAMGTRPSTLDNLIWQTMRRIGHLAPDRRIASV